MDALFSPEILEAGALKGLIVYSHRRHSSLTAWCVSVAGFQCRCGGLYCGLHRYSDKHHCSFDYKEHGQEQIRKNNPIIVGSKIQKI